jgi:hypothetical protein
VIDVLGGVAAALVIVAAFIGGIRRVESVRVRRDLRTALETLKDYDALLASQVRKIEAALDPASDGQVGRLCQHASLRSWTGCRSSMTPWMSLLLICEPSMHGAQMSASERSWSN